MALTRHPLLLLALLPSAVFAQSAQDPLLARTKGSARAPVTVYEMSDFQCPFCRQHAETTFRLLDREYIGTGKVRWVFINFPLTSIHDNAVAAAELAMCAARQGKFWPAHDLLFRHQGVWAPLKDPAPFLLTLADSLRLAKPRLTQCLAEGETRTEIRQDAEGAARSGASSTPSFWIEGGLMIGAQRIQVFRRVLDSIYTLKTAK
jgi:protein-disulfide isomerase